MNNHHRIIQENHNNSPGWSWLGNQAGNLIFKSKNTLYGLSIAVVLQMGVLAGSAQTNLYLYTGYEAKFKLAAGTYIVRPISGSQMFFQLTQ